ncbi:Fc receptor-like protein 4 [Ochotona curzoniae]|uniref:Fc receptor-like protein 4 n=1 Tax=Ochotona curzoniae TaxID=130825 RepID=UPI001B351B6D|nr:Fc receptor-like protein 4 [Ochotona curzoniae]
MAMGMQNGSFQLQSVDNSVNNKWSSRTAPFAVHLSELIGSRTEEKQTPYSLVPAATTLPQPAISLDPPWTTVFEGEKVTLTCDGFHLYNTTKTIWYNGNNKETQGEFMENTFVVRKSGTYKCQIQDSPHSDPVHLVFATATVILQSPYPVFEGDALVLRCQKKGKQKFVAAKYIYDGHHVYNSNQDLDLIIPQASLNNSGSYKCHGYEDQHTHIDSTVKIIKIQELFPHPELKATDSEPIEGSPVLLSCETQLPLARWDTPLQFIFFRDDMVILSDWNRSSELQIPTIWIENSGLYGCSAETLTHTVYKHSSLLEIRVQRIPVSQVSIEIKPPGGQASEGEKLVLVCSVVEGTGETTFSWHKENTRKHVGQKIQRSQRAELEISNIRESHTGKYYCTADNGFGPVQSEVVNITVTGTPGKRKAFVALGSCGGLFLLLAVALLCYYWCWRKQGLWTFLTTAQGFNKVSVPSMLQ